jgi:hypothetical protein
MQLEGVSPEEHRRLVRELAERQRQCTTMELELRAALDKLDVYRRADDEAATAPAPQATHGAAVSLASLAQQPDDEKGLDELRGELNQLRQAMALQGEEAQKVGSSYQTVGLQSGITCDPVFLVLCCSSVVSAIVLLNDQGRLLANMPGAYSVVFLMC